MTAMWHLRDGCGTSSALFIDRVLPYAPLITTDIAVAAVLIAMYSVLVQRSVARKRAAIDFFLKTEMDSGA